MQAKNKKIFQAITRYAKNIMLVAQAIAILLLLGSVLAWEVSPLKSNLFSYLGLAFPFILFLNVLFVLFWFVILKWKIGLVGVVVLLLFFNPIRTYYPINFRTKDIPKEHFKILTYNVRVMLHPYEKSEKKSDMIDYINRSEADIVCFQEFTYLIGSSNKEIKLALQKMFPAYKHISFINLKNAYNTRYGIVCMSKFPIDSSERLPFEYNGNGAAIFLLDINGKDVSLIINHLQSNRLTSEDKQSYKEVIKDGLTNQIDYVASNLHMKLGTAYRERTLQANVIAEAVKNLNTDATIVCGDFNDTPISYTYKTVKGDLKDAFRDTGSGVGITYNENYFWFRIDYILHSDNLTAYNATVDKVKYSDHYPLWTYLSFNDKESKKK